MKKIISIIVLAAMLFSFAACGQTSMGNGGTNTSANQTSSEATTILQDKNSAPDSSDVVNGATTEAEDSSHKELTNEKYLVVYFSWSTSGNTEKMATLIAENTNADIYEIEPKTAYPTDYNECGDVAKVERDENKRPEIANLPANLDKYDTIFIGYPIWWHTAPMIIGTFLENYDLSGKEVYPFTQSASMNTEQFENSMKFVRESAKNANVHDGLFVSASNTDAILAYLNENGFNK